MKTSIRLKLLLLFTLSLGGSLIISFLLHWLFFSPYYLNHTEKRLLEVFDEVESNLHAENFEEIVAEIDYRQQVGIIIADEHFDYSFFAAILNSATGEKLATELKGLISSQAQTLKDSHICVQLDDDSLHGEDSLARMVVIKKLSNGYYCILSHPLSTLESSVDAMNHFHLLAMGVAFLLGLLSTFYYAGRFTNPIIEINEATKQMSKLDFQQKISYQSQDELGELASNINILSEKLEENRVALKKEIAFQKVLSQNMSHELKTPISVMKGYLDAIAYGIAAKKNAEDEYIAVVLEECDRMNELIGQMLHLSKLTSVQNADLVKSSFSSQDFAYRIAHQHNGLLSQHNVTYDESVPDLDLWGNQELLAQGLGNFVTNAVKYGDKKRILFTIEETETHHNYCVFNTGQPLPDEECDKVFDVFYMVDKARSREQNSHGLGLSVSKTIAELHNGTVCCTNSHNGITFSFCLPKKNMREDGSSSS